MTAALAVVLMAGAATIFVPAEDLGLGTVGGGRNIMELVHGLRHVDIDGDGDTDIVREDAVFFLQNGKGAGTAPMPPLPRNDSRDIEILGDFWRNQLFLLGPLTLDVYRWEDGGWRVQHSQSLGAAAPAIEGETGETVESLELEEGEEEAGAKTTLGFRSFLQDVNGDGIPELIYPTRQGLEVFVKRGEQYGEAGVLDVLPPLRPTGWMRWTDNPDSSAFPPRSMGCVVALHGSRLTVIDQERLLSDGADVRFHVTRYNIRLDDSGVTAEKTDTMTTPPLPAYGGGMHPMRLNGDDVIDFAGHGRERADSQILPAPTGIVHVSTDGGRTLQSLRMTGPPLDRFPDWDGDGDCDIVTRNIGLFEGGVREVLTRALTHRTVRHELGIHLQDADGRFPRQSNLRWRGSVELDAPPWKRTEFMRRYLLGELIGFGKFDGDARMDLAVVDRPDRVSVYLAGPEGYPAKPDLTIAIDPGWAVFPKDIDGDGRDDLVCADLGTHEVTKVLFSREKRP